MLIMRQSIKAAALSKGSGFLLHNRCFYPSAGLTGLPYKRRYSARRFDHYVVRKKITAVLCIEIPVYSVFYTFRTHFLSLVLPLLFLFSSFFFLSVRCIYARMCWWCLKSSGINKIENSRQLFYQVLQS